MLQYTGMTQVVAAIFENNGRILICQRTPGQSHPLKWEFPGGKVEPGESPEQGLARELEEELAVTGARGEEMERYQFAYPGKAPIELIFYRVIGICGRAAQPHLPRHALGGARGSNRFRFRGRRPRFPAPVCPLYWIL